MDVKQLSRRKLQAETKISDYIRTVINEFEVMNDISIFDVIIPHDFKERDVEIRLEGF